jgi:CRISPR/Cas system CSM-associated protein Csm3 (group 7 of RAMP superfamily)
MKQTIKFTGTIVAETGVTIVRPNDNFMGGGLSEKTSRLPRAGAKRQDTDVFIPGSTLRGAIRRAAQCRVEAHLMGDELAPIFSLSEHYMLRQGVDITGAAVNEKSAGTIDKEASLRRSNPLLSAFGRWKLAGHVGIYGLHPVNKDCVMVDGKGARSNDFIRTPERIGLLSTEDQAQLNTLLEEDALASLEMEPINNQVKELKKTLKLTSETDAKDALNIEIAELNAQVKGIKDNKTNREAIQRPLDGFEAIIPGTVFEHKMMLQNSSTDELGLFLEALAEFSRDPRIGGHHNHGYGVISMKYDVTTFPRLADEPILIGEVTVSKDGIKITDLTTDNTLLNARKAFIQNLNNGQYDFGRFLLDEKEA